ncbi:hypothetical protein GXW83_18505 [Streptacidiphilus sp. PB12-B1b]|uniref:hypothetical protein n=1 Tax=Streptacidiphilus sp. PB12-B1b TaxID=2705012 RepID=UPI0015FA6F16|nr:hypothetical protein [Streptacidiphilus sp. PB12-B1b]QMU77393.1 hypothetical protein GXW83_18505 [Streptacidiphilus sp. PB12-B1b]
MSVNPGPADQQPADVVPRPVNLGPPTEEHGGTDRPQERAAARPVASPSAVAPGATGKGADARDAVEVVALDGHDYTVRFTREGDSARFQLRADPEALDQLPQGVDETATVREAVLVLAERQRVADLPKTVDLSDLFALYPDFREALGYRLGRS